MAEKIKDKYSNASYVANVFAHCDDLSGITDAVSKLLSPEVFVFEVSYLVDVYQKTL